MTFINETAAADGSYTAMVVFFGTEYSVNYINCEIRVYATRELSTRRWQTRKNPDQVRKLIAARIQNLGPVFQAAHEALYSEAA